jgi:hypothetical protein
MFVTELDTFVKKFQQLWNDGLTAHLDLDTQAGNAWVGLRVQLGHAPGPPHHHQVHPFQKVHRNVESPSRQRRRARRAAAQQTNAVKATVTETGEVNEVENGKETTEDVVDKVTNVVNIVAEDPIEEISVDAPTKVQDEICTDAEYLKKVDVTEKVTEKKMCTVDFYPQNLDTIEDFRKDVESYFKKRKDIIEEVIESRVEDFGRRVKLRSVVKIRFAWTSFFNDPARNYSDLPGIRTVRHGCENLSQCDPAPS